ncbi:winged helix-turn-helix transcriptional regulator [Propionispora vibrioides]|jgi:DNA-binding HxlR family transcriptional regulator|uniref:DNA-binding transcriptional regulator, HxlR family n=1 Tax=Propionispora vibrioides TaxID=112903 RepID=A0A1H8W5G2_9FIRM|nr:helix-turn-helix domain-containing protein [Propionispora vibrioides]SEP22839.1 DNA-binding transcriptional regulator, HxlR family [Propionispora vibrioides]
MKKWSTETCTCSITYTLSIISSKWKWLLLYKLFQNGVQRYGEIKRSIPPITHKMLSQQLKELEEESLINRKEYPQIPPKVEYSLTTKGETLIPVLELMSQWGAANKPAVK